MSRLFHFDSLEARVHLHAGHGFHAEVNFTSAGQPAMSNFIADTGATFGLKDNGFVYGWDINNATNARVRGASASVDPAFDTLNHMQKDGSRKWELSLPNGTYNVRIVAGDASFFDSVFKINVEGKLIVNGTPTSANRWVEGSGKVTVSDGRLTLTNATGSKNNKINFIEVALDEGTTAPPQPEPAPSAGWSSIASMPIARTEAAQAIKDGKLYVFGGFFNTGWDATKRVDVYDPSTNKWTQLPDMPVAITHAATVVDGNNAILVGGYVGDEPGQATADVWMYNVVNKSWSKLPSLPAARGGGGAGIVGTTLYFFGGNTRNPNGTSKADHGNTWGLDLSNLGAGWKAKANMPLPRNHLGFATVGGKIYSIGGQLLDRESTANQSAVHAYNPSTNTWSAVASLPMALGHFHAGTIVHEGQIIIAGGVMNGFKNTDRIHAYDPSTNTWTYVATLPTVRKSVSLMIHNKTIYVAGGGNNTALASGFKATWAPTWRQMKSMPVALGEVAAGVIGKKLYVVGESNTATLAYDYSNNVWSSTTELAKRPFGGHHHGAEVLNGKLYLIGGLGASAGKLQIFDPSANKWTVGPNIPFSTGSASTALIGGKIYVAGGIVGSSSSNSSGTGTTNQAAVFNPTSNSWSAIASMPKGVNHAAAGTDGSKLYVFGGRDGKNVVGNGFSTVQIYNPSTNQWITSDNPSSGIAPMPVGRGGTGKAVYSAGEFYIMGGETLNGGGGATSNNVYKRVDVYRPSTNTWRAGPSLPTARHGIFPVLHAQRIYVAGGGVKAAFSNSTVNEVLQLS